MLRSALRAAGLEVRRVGAQDWGDPRTYLPFAQTLADAKAAGLSVGDFIDVQHNQPGATQAVIDRLAGLGVYEGRIDRVCEIGPGSGRYLEKTMAICKPGYYEIYETEKGWANWLIAKYGVILQRTGGTTLAATPSASIDLVQAHKVFVVTPLLATFSYLLEMARVVRPGGMVVFDVMTEACIDDATIQRWLAANINWGLYPGMCSRQVVIDLLTGRGLSLVGTFLEPMRPGSTECMVFKRPAA